MALLGPLNAQLDEVLATGDEQSALRLAFERASQAVSLVSEQGCGEAALHKVYVELAPLALATYDDGTLAEHVPYVTLAYQHWRVAREEAERLAGEWGLNTSWAIDTS